MGEKKKKWEQTVFGNCSAEMKVTVMIEGICILDLLEGNAVMLQQHSGQSAAGWFASGDSSNTKEEEQTNHEAMVVDRNWKFCAFQGDQDLILR